MNVREVYLDQLVVSASSLTSAVEAASAISHTILFIRSMNRVRPREAESATLEGLRYPFFAEGDAMISQACASITSAAATTTTTTTKAVMVHVNFFVKKPQVNNNSLFTSIFAHDSQGGSANSISAFERWYLPIQIVDDHPSSSSSNLCAAALAHEVRERLLYVYEMTNDCCDHIPSGTYDYSVHVVASPQQQQQQQHHHHQHQHGSGGTYNPQQQQQQQQQQSDSRGSVDNDSNSGSNGGRASRSRSESFGSSTGASLLLLKTINSAGLL